MIRTYTNVCIVCHHFYFLFFCWYGISPVFVMLFLALVWSCININLGYTVEFGSSTKKFELLPCLSFYQDSFRYDNFTSLAS